MEEALREHSTIIKLRSREQVSKEKVVLCTSWAEAERERRATDIHITPCLDLRCRGIDH